MVQQGTYRYDSKLRPKHTKDGNREYFLGKGKIFIILQIPHMPYFEFLFVYNIKDCWKVGH